MKKINLTLSVLLFLVGCNDCVLYDEGSVYVFSLINKTNQNINVQTYQYKTNQNITLAPDSLIQYEINDYAYHSLTLPEYDSVDIIIKSKCYRFRQVDDSGPFCISNYMPSDTIKKRVKKSIYYTYHYEYYITEEL